MFLQSHFYSLEASSLCSNKEMQGGEFYSPSRNTQTTD